MTGSWWFAHVPLSSHSDGWQAQACALQTGCTVTWQGGSCMILRLNVVRVTPDLCQCCPVNGMLAPNPWLTQAAGMGGLRACCGIGVRLMLARLLCLLYHTPSAPGGFLKDSARGFVARSPQPLGLSHATASRISGSDRVSHAAELLVSTHIAQSSIRTVLCQAAIAVRRSLARRQRQCLCCIPHEHVDRSHRRALVQAACSTFASAHA